MGYIGPIPSSHIRAAAEKYGDEARAFTFCIREMDAAYLNAVRPPKKGQHRIMKTPLKPGMLQSMVA